MRLAALPWLVLLGCGTSGDSPDADALAPGDGYEGMNFYEANGDEPPSIDSAPVGNVPGSYEFVSGEELPVCSAGVGERPTAPIADTALACPRVTHAVITDFTFTGNPNSVSFAGDAAFPGGTYHYPDASDALRSDVTNGDWHIYGTVRDVSGFGLYFNACQQLDAAAYRGIAFKLWGQIGDGGALVFYVGTSVNQVASSWVNANKADPSAPDEPANMGRCVPVSGRYDGTCREARRILTVPAQPENSLVLWRDLADGCPDPSVDPSEINTIAWYFPQPVSGSYTVDIHVDDLRFTNEGPL
jgi:hypothetical protein